ncbi:hypothetical protein [Anaerocolumna sp.]|uniref:hypothetical protein n=1 Tax=Anaerocolumna sp. TaxID=2041569 RepID=UPI0028AFB06E|nr:hypothetical protein [Anaerocolumna sp.]
MKSTPAVSVLLREYAEKNGFPNPRLWADDGYSGVSFDRFGYNEVITEVEAAKRGERITPKPPYGCKKDSNDPKRIVSNEDTAPIVRRIFTLCISVLNVGKNYTQQVDVYFNFAGRV